MRERLASLTTEAPPAAIPVVAPSLPSPVRPLRTRDVHVVPASAARLIRQDGTVIATLPCDPSVGPLTLGRGMDATIRIGDDAVSRVHAYIRWDDASGTHVIEDAGGPNGTTVNHVRIQSQARLHDGARIRVGRTVIFYQH